MSFLVRHTKQSTNKYTMQQDEFLNQIHLHWTSEHTELTIKHNAEVRGKARELSRWLPSYTFSAAPPRVSITRSETKREEKCEQGYMGKEVQLDMGEEEEARMVSWRDLVQWREENTEWGVSARLGERVCKRGRGKTRRVEGDGVVGEDVFQV